jgi:hypothetical protein
MEFLRNSGVLLVGRERRGLLDLVGHCTCLCVVFAHINKTSTSDRTTKWSPTSRVVREEEPADEIMNIAHRHAIPLAPYDTAFRSCQIDGCRTRRGCPWQAGRGYARLSKRIADGRTCIIGRVSYIAFVNGQIYVRRAQWRITNKVHEC